MPTKYTVDHFIARVVEGAHSEAIEEFYTTSASMQESNSEPRKGKALLVAKERSTLTRIEEPANQRWEGDLIVQETFFYDPAQFITK